MDFFRGLIAVAGVYFVGYGVFIAGEIYGYRDGYERGYRESGQLTFLANKKYQQCLRIVRAE